MPSTTVCCPNRVPDDQVCKLPVACGQGSASLNRWYFDAQAGCCKQFVYKRKLGNQNNFLTLEECSKACTGTFNFVQFTTTITINFKHFSINTFPLLTSFSFQSNRPWPKTTVRKCLSVWRATVGRWKPTTTSMHIWKGTRSLWGPTLLPFGTSTRRKSMLRRWTSINCRMWRTSSNWKWNARARRNGACSKMGFCSRWRRLHKFHFQRTTLQSKQLFDRRRLFEELQWFVCVPPFLLWFPVFCSKCSWNYTNYNFLLSHQSVQIACSIAVGAMRSWTRSLRKSSEYVLSHW